MALEDGDDLFMDLAAAMEDEEDEDKGHSNEAARAPVGQRSTNISSGREHAAPLLCAAGAGAAGSDGTVPPGHQPRRAILLPPGFIPCGATVPPQLITAQPVPTVLPTGNGVAVFGAAGPGAAGSGGGSSAAQGSFSDVGQGSLVERYAGLKIRNPRVSHSQLRARLADAAVLKLSQVRQRHRTAGLEGSWVTICVVGEKSKPRETATGRTYSIWKVTDLDQTCLSLFLFSGANAELWREPEGTLVALVAPKVKANGDFSLSVDSANQVWVLGHSPEFGYCKAKKKNGEPCRMPVNTTRCPFCPYHVQTEYNRMKPTGRNEFQTTNLKTAFRAGMQKALQWTPGEFETAAAKQQRIATLPPSQLEGVASNAKHRGSAAGARYLSTVANPTAAAASEAAAQRRLSPAAAIAAAAAKGPAAAQLAAAPIPSGRNTGTLVLQQPQPARKASRQKRKAEAAALAEGGSRRRSSGGGGGRKRAEGSCASDADSPASAAGNAEEPDIKLEADEEEALQASVRSVPPSAALSAATVCDPARQRAIELLKAAGGAVPADSTTGQPVASTPATSAAAQQFAGAGSTASQQGRQPVARPSVPPPARGTLSAPPAGGTVAAADGRQRSAFSAAQVHRLPPVPSVMSGGPSVPRPACRRSTSAANAAENLLSVATSRGPAAAGVCSADGGKAVRKPPPAPPRPKSAMEEAFGAVVAAAEAADAAAKGTRYKQLVDDEEHEKLDKVMGALEQRDEMAARMDSVKHLAVQAFRCKLCNYTAERRRAACAAHPHAVERVEATKRWWECQGCKYRFSTVGQRYPAGRCAKCNEPGTEFKAVSMLRPHREHDFQRQQSAMAGRDLVLARGNEQKWANSW